MYAVRFRPAQIREITSNGSLAAQTVPGDTVDSYHTMATPKLQVCFHLAKCRILYHFTIFGIYLFLRVIKVGISSVNEAQGTVAVRGLLIV